MDGGANNRRYRLLFRIVDSVHQFISFELIDQYTQPCRTTPHEPSVF